MKSKIIIFLTTLVASIGLQGCYTQIAKDDPYVEEYKIIKENPEQYADEEVEYDTVYVDENGNPIEEETNAGGDVYYINNNYYDDFVIYRHYFDTYSPCFYCDPYFYGSVFIVGGWYYAYYPPVVYYYPPVYYYPYYYGYPPYYYRTPYKTRRYNARVRNYFGRSSLAVTRRRGRMHAARTDENVVNRSRTERRGKTVRTGASNDNANVNLDDLIVGRNGGGKRKDGGKNVIRKNGNNSKEAITGKEKKRVYKTSPPVRAPKRGTITKEAVSSKSGINAKKQTRQKKKKVIIYKKRNDAQISGKNKSEFRSRKLQKQSGVQKRSSSRKTQSPTYRSGGAKHKTTSGRTRSTTRVRTESRSNSHSSRSSGTYRGSSPSSSHGKSRSGSSTRSGGARRRR